MPKEYYVTFRRRLVIMGASPFPLLCSLFALLLISPPVLLSMPFLCRKTTPSCSAIQVVCG